MTAATGDGRNEQAMYPDCGEAENLLANSNFSDDDVWTKVRVKTMKEKIEDACDEIETLLISKNKAYGNSAADPCNIFGSSTALEGMCTRIDDKLNRIMKGKEFPGDDTVLDLIGYLILYRIVKEEQDGQMC